ncbi:AAA family ATPase [Streptomyces coffeae]|uniref:MoxR family ATPase n=1 Tax=Streptomyces coffeae TaxID=621382 RepID=A0ABS1NJK8_9ACTN|nr:MoxR family ATPase [Streptomyces coffeae]MBL1100294.1 MoxR family ATPase [Streptomyces coffeae]
MQRPAQEDFDGLRIRFDTVAEAVGEVLRGKREAIRLALICLMAEGHLLIEDVPGVGKTSLARALAAAFGVTSGRIQFTPDLLPSDITGVQVLERGAFTFQPGPVFAHIVICDEVNRASPKAQAALLEVMEERQVSVAGETRPVPRPFMVVATQNPIDFEGTYPLPEAQLDRFLMRVSIGPPDARVESEILAREATTLSPEATIGTVLDRESLRGMIETARRVRVDGSVNDYIAALLQETRSPAHREEIRLGASTRAGLALLRAARVSAAAEGLQGVLPDQVRALAVPVLAHRLVLTERAVWDQVTSEDVIRRILSRVPVPR